MIGSWLPSTVEVVSLAGRPWPALASCWHHHGGTIGFLGFFKKQENRRGECMIRKAAVQGTVVVSRLQNCLFPARADCWCPVSCLAEICAWCDINNISAFADSRWTQERTE